MESSIVLLLFLVILIGVLDIGQILFLHQFLSDRARVGVRYAAVHRFDAAEIRNVVAYNSATPGGQAAGLFGLTPSMIQVRRYTDRVEVGISGYSMRFLSPWLAGSFAPGPFRAVMPVESAGVAE